MVKDNIEKNIKKNILFLKIWMRKNSWSTKDMQNRKKKMNGLKLITCRIEMEYGNNEIYKCSEKIHSDENEMNGIKIEVS